MKFIRSLIISVTLLGLLAAGCNKPAPFQEPPPPPATVEEPSPAPAPAPPPLSTQAPVPDSNYQTVVVLPDTQYITQSYPDILDAQIRWIIANAAAENIIHVIHLGDVVQLSDDTKQWQVAIDVMRGPLKAGAIPMIVTAGNHDLDRGDVWFQSVFGGLQSYALLEIWGQPFIIVAVNGYGPYVAASCQWADGVLNKYAARKAIISVHGYIDKTGAKIEEYAGGDPKYGGERGIYVWENLVRRHDNIVMVVSGHVWEEGFSTDYSDGGTLITNILSNYQERPHPVDGKPSGNGWLRLYRFHEDMETVDTLTYSPYLGKYEIDGNSQFSFSLVTPN